MDINEKLGKVLLGNFLLEFVGYGKYHYLAFASLNITQELPLMASTRFP
jgi:hypothetical protein